VRLESGFNSGTGVSSNSTTLFDRTAAVGLGGRDWELRFGRQEGFGYELAATGVTDPLSMALNLPNYSSPAAAGSRAPVLGANPLQSLYSYTYGQLRFNNAVRLSAASDIGGAGGLRWSGGLMNAFGGVAGSPSANTLRAAAIGAGAGPLQVQALFQQSIDPGGHHSSLAVVAANWAQAAWRLQAGVHDLRIGAAFDSSGLGNGASSSGILGSSTTVAAVLAGPRQDFRYTIADLGTTVQLLPALPLSLVAYKTRSEGAGRGNSLAQVALAKWYLNRRTALFLEADHAVSSGTLARNPLSHTATALAYMAGVNVRF
jgi:predicted porin